MSTPEWELILRKEFDAEDGSFLLQIRVQLVWDRSAFLRLINAMEQCASELTGASDLPRWIANGFWYFDNFVQEWSSHPSFPREHPPDYYEAAYDRLNGLAYWLFFDDHPELEPFQPLP